MLSRIQSIAPTGSIGISKDTRALVEGYFELKIMGSFRLKGITEPVEIDEPSTCTSQCYASHIAELPSPEPASRTL
jgi:class 3 adenylate cyclase